MAIPHISAIIRKAINNKKLYDFLLTTSQTLHSSADLFKLIKDEKCQNHEVCFLINELQDNVKKLLDKSQAFESRLKHSNLEPLLYNVDDVLERIQNAIFDTCRPKIAEAKELCELQLIPLCRIVQEVCVFWCVVNPDKNLHHRYITQEFGYNLCNRKVTGHGHLLYQATVIVVAYNKLEQTRRCVESIINNTDFNRLNAHLILVDHGSTDGTLEYFQSVKQATVLHFKHNMSITMFLMMPMICCSPYYVHVANDTVVTKDWLEILLTCIKSDPKIVLASPATPNISNRQSLNVPKVGRADLENIASYHNRSNPQLWMERTQVYPPLGIFNISILNKIGFWDPFFYTFYCSDDDFSTRARRAGYKQILCGDVYCYHEPKDAAARERTLQGCVQGVKLFSKRYGFKPLSHGYCYDPVIMEMIHPLPTSGTAHVLAVNCGIGDTPLQIRNALRKAGLESDIYYVSSEKMFVEDVKPIAHELVETDARSLPQAIKESFPDLQFAYVCMDKEIKGAQLHYDLVEALASRMTTNSKLLFTVQNPLFIENVILAQELKLPGLIPFNWQNIDRRLSTQFSTYNYEASGWQNYPMEYLREHTAAVFPELSDKLIEQLQIRYYYVWAKK